MNIKIKLVLLIFFSFLFGYFLFHTNLKSQWSIIDDHEIANFLGSDRHLNLAEIPGTLANTEIGKFANYSRYRPSYYVLRVFEAYIFAGNPHLWYFSRYLILVLFIFTVSFIVSNYFGVIFALIFSMFIMLGKYWPDIWSRLGPAEIYVVLGSCLFSLAIINILRSKTRVLNWVFMTIGGLIAIGSKENMAMLVFPVCYLLIEPKLKKQRLHSYISLFVLSIYSIFIYSSVFLAISKTGHDVYSNPVNARWAVHLFFASFFKEIESVKVIWLILFSIIVSSVLLFSRKTKNIKKNLQNLFRPIGLLLYFIAILVFQIIFYSGNWPTNTRYDFPGVLVFYLCWLVILYLITKKLPEIIKIKSALFNKCLNYFILILLVLMVGVIIKNGFKEFELKALSNLESTSVFTGKMKDIASLTNKEKDMKIIIVSRSPWDFEPVVSLSRYFKFYGIKNDTYFDYYDSEYDSEAALAKNLSSRLTVLKNTGYLDNEQIFNPVPSALIKTNCISIALYKAVDKTGCKYQFRF